MPKPSSKGGFPTRKKTAKKAASDDNEFVEDEIDVFHKQRDKIGFDQDDDEIQDSGEEDQIDSVYDLDVNEDETFEADQEEEEEEKPQKKAKKQKFPTKKHESDSEEEQDKLANEKLPESWGGKKYAYYANKEHDEDAQGEQEEKEVRRLHKKQLESMSDSAFLGDDDVPKKKSKSKVEKSSDESQVEVEQVKKDISKMTNEQKLQIVARESPELLTLLEDFKNTIAQIREQLQPLRQQIKEGQLPTSRGSSYLEMKYHLLMSYCTDIVFYLLLKAEGKSVKDHPVIDELVRIRTLLEKLKPIDGKLKNQMDKMLKMATLGQATLDSSDARSFKPRPDQLVVDENEQESTIDVEDSRPGVYRPPQLSQTKLVDKRDKAAEKEERLRKKMAGSEMLSLIKSQVTDEPETEYAGGLMVPKVIDEDERERQEYEEDYKVRLMVTKKDKKKQQEKNEFKNSLEKLTRFDDIAMFSGEKDKKKLNEQRFAEQQRDSRKRKASQMDDEEILSDLEDDEGVPTTTRGGNDERDEDLDYYKSMQKEQNQRKQAKRRKFEEKQNEDRQQERERKERETARFNMGGGKRAINNQIEKNRGLTRARPKDKKTPHSRLRNNFEKATSKHRGQSRPMKDSSRPYGGESSINSSLSRSIKLNQK